MFGPKTHKDGHIGQRLCPKQQDNITVLPVPHAGVGDLHGGRAGVEPGEVRQHRRAHEARPGTAEGSHPAPWRQSRAEASERGRIHTSAHICRGGVQVAWKHRNRPQLPACRRRRGLTRSRFPEPADSRGGPALRSLRARLPALAPLGVFFFLSVSLNRLPSVAFLTRKRN